MRKNKRIITESERQADLIKRQQAIIESFGKEFNKIKRIDEDESEDNLMRYIDNRRDDLEMQLKSAIIKAVDIEVASRTLDTPQGAVMDPFDLMYRTIKSGFAKIEDVDARFVESAIETMESQDHPEGHGFGSSDGTYLMGDFLSDAGYNVDYSSGRLVATKGGMNEQDPVGDGFGAEYEQKEDNDNVLNNIIGGILSTPKEFLVDYNYDGSMVELNFYFQDDQYDIEGRIIIFLDVDDIKMGYYKPATFHDPPEGENTTFELSVNSLKVYVTTDEQVPSQYGDGYVYKEELLTTNTNLIENNYMDMWDKLELEEWLTEQIDDNYDPY